MLKEHERREYLKSLDQEKRDREEKRMQELKEKHRQHPKVNSPVGSKCIFVDFYCQPIQEVYLWCFFVCFSTLRAVSLSCGKCGRRQMASILKSSTPKPSSSFMVSNRSSLLPSTTFSFHTKWLDFISGPSRYKWRWRFRWAGIGGSLH